MPSLYRWKVRSRIYRWYREIEELDPAMTEYRDRIDLEKNVERLNDIEKQVSQIFIPLGYRDELYDLRMHIDMLRRKLKKDSNE